MGFADDVVRGIVRISLGYSCNEDKNENNKNEDDSIKSRAIISESYGQIYSKLSSSLDRLSKIGTL